MKDIQDLMEWINGCIRVIIDNKGDVFTTGKEVGQLQVYLYELNKILNKPLKEEITDTQKEFDQLKTGVATFNDGFKLGVNWCKKYGIPNDDSTPPNPTKNVIVGGIEYLSPRDVWEREKKAFEAGKKTEKIHLFNDNWYQISDNKIYNLDKYPTFEDYKKANP